MSEYTNSPINFYLPPIAEESKTLFVVVMIVFAVWFYVGIHYKLHVWKHGFPPFYMLKIQRSLSRLTRKT